MSNKVLLEEKLKEMNMIIGGYDDTLEKLSKKEIKKVIENMWYGSTDIGVQIRRKKYVVEVYHVDDEVDFGLISVEEYANQYGREVGE